MIDETTDNSTDQQLIIYIRYLQKQIDGSFSIAIEYLDLICPLSGEAKDIVVC